MKTFEIGGMTYGPDETESLRTELILLRDEALTAGAMHRAVTLSHIIALIAAMKREIWQEVTP